MKLPVEEIKKIVIFRALQLGDMLCSIPAIRALRYAYPDASITLVGLPWSKSLLEKFPNYFNEVIIFPGYPGLPEQDADIKKFPSFITEIQNREFDLAIQMQGNGGISNPLVRLFDAKYTAGFYRNNKYCPNENLYIEYPKDEPEVLRHLQLMDRLGIERQGVDLEYPLTKKDEEELKSLSLPIEQSKYVIVHPGSRGLERRWATEHFAALGDYFAMQGFAVVITGTNDEMPVVESVAEFMQQKPIIAAGKTSLGAVGVLIKNAYALISNCTGVSHIASALKTRSIVISLDGEPERWTPLNKQIHRTIDWAKTQDYDVVLNEAKSLISNRS